MARDDADKVEAKLEFLLDQLEEVRKYLLTGKFGPASREAKKIKTETDCAMCENLAVGVAGGITFVAAARDDEEVEDRREHVLSGVDHEIEQIESELGEEREAVADGGYHTFERDGAEYAVTVGVTYPDDADVKVRDGQVVNHDELPKIDKVRVMSVDTVEDVGWEDQVIGPSDTKWEDRFEDLEPGEEITLGAE